MLKGKTVLLGVTGGIACYKAVELASLMVKKHCDVYVIMTENATEFITPLTFETITGNRTVVDTFDRNRLHQVEHISLADKTDLVLIAPATANVLAKLAHGLADDMLTTTVLACNCKKIAAPAMNTRMYENAVTQDNLNILIKYGWDIIEPASGRLACGDIGKGKLPNPEDILETVLYSLSYKKDMTGLKILVTAGPTQEALDPVRYLTNHSSGKMGYAIAKAAAYRGADVTLVSGPTSLKKPSYVNVIDVVTARDMFNAVTKHIKEQDIIIKAAAVADYRPKDISEEKIKKTNSNNNDLTLQLERTDDILSWLGNHRLPNQTICGFAMETQSLLENAKQKLERKNVDMIAANSLRDNGAGFGVDTNILTLITKDKEIPLPMLSKEDAAHKLLDELLNIHHNTIETI